MLAGGRIPHGYNTLTPGNRDGSCVPVSEGAIFAGALWRTARALANHNKEPPMSYFPSALKPLCIAMTLALALPAAAVELTRDNGAPVGDNQNYKLPAPMARCCYRTCS